MNDRAKTMLTGFCLMFFASSIGATPMLSLAKSGPFRIVTRNEGYPAEAERGQQTYFAFGEKLCLERVVDPKDFSASESAPEISSAGKVPGWILDIETGKWILGFPRLGAGKSIGNDDTIITDEIALRARRANVGFMDGLRPESRQDFRPSPPDGTLARRGY